MKWKRLAFAAVSAIIIICVGLFIYNFVGGKNISVHSMNRLAQVMNEAHLVKLYHLSDKEEFQSTYRTTHPKGIIDKNELNSEQILELRHIMRNSREIKFRLFENRQFTPDYLLLVFASDQTETELWISSHTETFAASGFGVVRVPSPWIGYIRSLLP